MANGDTEILWGWGTPAGKIRADRRAKLIATAAGLKPGMRVLEIGCGTGLFTEKFAKLGAFLLAVDISPDLLKKAQQRSLSAEQVIFKLTKFEDCAINGPFDAIIGSSILHHLDLIPALNKMHELLKPGGRIAFAEPNFMNPQIFITYNFRHFFPEISPDENAFLRWKLAKACSEESFKSIKITPFDWLHPNTPKKLIPAVKKCGSVLEKLPAFCEFAGSLLISAKKS